MAAGGKKRRKRKGAPSGGKSAPEASPVAGASVPFAAPEVSAPSADSSGGGGGGAVTSGATDAGQLGDVLEGDRGIEELFSDDWSGMPANTGMVKSKVGFLAGGALMILCTSYPMLACSMIDTMNSSKGFDFALDAQSAHVCAVLTAP